ncbi:hypothetical protein COC47_28075 [Bacillus cereus]|nr:hypothetical protein COC47_28075 [Bacillus cereus]
MEESEQYLNSLGWTKEDITHYGEPIAFEEGKVVLPSYLAHLVEIVDVGRIREDIKELWEPLRLKYKNLLM